MRVWCPGVQVDETGDILSLTDQTEENLEEEEEEERRGEGVCSCAVPLPGGGRLDVSRVGAAGTGGLSLPGQEGLTRASVGQSVFSRHLLQGHTLKKMDVLIRSQPRGQTCPPGQSATVTSVPFAMLS